MSNTSIADLAAEEALLTTTLIQKMHSDATVSVQVLPDCPSIQLYLVDEAPMRRPFSEEEIKQIENYPAYWSFCWASGYVQAQYILKHPELVKDKTIIDFGAGSGVVAIAAMQAGAKRAIACDIDPDALVSCRVNAALNNVELEYSDDIFAIQDKADLLIAADVLYDRENLRFLDLFKDKAEQSLIADSRIKNFQHPEYKKIETVESHTFPDLDEANDFRCVNIYLSI